MKKTYQMPAIKWVEAEAEDMLVASQVESGFNMSQPIGTTQETSGNLSRKHNDLWEIDEEE